LPLLFYFYCLVKDFILSIIQHSQKMKTKFALLFVLGILFACQQPKTDDSLKTNDSPKMDESPKIKKGMIKMAILYPNGDGKTFDMDYYVNKHMTLAKTLMGDSVKIIAIDKGLASGTPDTPVPYLAMGYFYFETMSAFKNSMGPVRDKLVADVPNFTNIKPIVQISEVQQ
jgi:uncharacterized protein (TIGR02118 family)